MFAHAHMKVGRVSKKGVIASTIAIALVSAIVRNHYVLKDMLVQSILESSQTQFSGMKDLEWKWPMILPDGFESTDAVKDLPHLVELAKTQYEYLEAQGKVPAQNPVSTWLKEQYDKLKPIVDEKQGEKVVTKIAESDGSDSSSGWKVSQTEMAQRPMSPEPPTASNADSAASKAATSANAAAAATSSEAPSKKESRGARPDRSQTALVGSLGIWSKFSAQEYSDAEMHFGTSMGTTLTDLGIRGTGVILGVGSGEFAFTFAKSWKLLESLFLVDPYIHLVKGYDDPGNLSDLEHQQLYERLFNMVRSDPLLATKDVRFIRDFSYSFLSRAKKLSQETPFGPAGVAFLYLDSNHAYDHVIRDLNDWWPQVVSGGIVAGSMYVDDDGKRFHVGRAVTFFAEKVKAQVSLVTASANQSIPLYWVIRKL